MNIFSGIWPALVTPSNADGTVNHENLHALIDYLIGKGVHGFYIGGTTGEGVFTSFAERMKLIESSLRHIDGRVPAIVHIGAVAVGDAEAYARHAHNHGAAAISSIIPPFYESMESIGRYYRAIAAATPELPLLVYLLNPRIDSVALMRSLMDIPNLGGAKYTGPNMYEMRSIIDLGGGAWTLFSGMDEQAAFGVMTGANGLIGSTLNFMPGAYQHIYRAVQEGRIADAHALQLRVNRVTAAMIEAGFSGALKTVLSDILGVEMGHPRLPSLPITAEGKAALRAALSRTDYDQLVAM